MPLLVRFTSPAGGEGTYIDVRDVMSVVFLPGDDEAPGRTVITTYRGLSFFVLESPSEVAAKIREAIHYRDMGLEVGDD